jgi:hydroxypyruvate isomerase
MSHDFSELGYRKGQKMNGMQSNLGQGRVTRRDVLAGAAAVAAGSVPVRASKETPDGVTTNRSIGKIVKNGRIKQSICSGCLGRSKMDPEQVAKLLVEMGLMGRDLMGPAEWPVLKQYGLVATMVPGAGSIKKGLNDKSMHPKFLEDFKANIKAAAEYKWPNDLHGGDRGSATPRMDL